MRPATVKAAVLQFAVCLVFASVAACLLIVLFTGKKAVVIVGLGSMVLVALLMISGNPRLFCLWGLLLTAPLDLSKRFKIIAHMGGASAFRIELVDFFILALVVFLLRDLVKGYRQKLRFSGISVYWGFLILLGLGTVIVGPFRTSASHEVFRMCKCLLLFLVVVNELVRVRQFIHVVLALMAGMLLEASIAIVQYVFDLRLGLQTLGEDIVESIEATTAATFVGGTMVYRVGALLGHPNLLAAYIAMLLPMGIAVLLARIKLRYKIICLTAVVLGEVALILTLSRTAWIAFGVGLLGVAILTFIHPRLRSRYIFVRGAVLAAMIVSILILSGPIMSRIYRSDPGALKVRFEWLDVSWRMIKDKPIFGVGLNAFVFSMPAYTKYGSPRAVAKKYGKNWPVVHNIYALTWAEQGTIGFMAFLLMHAHIIWIAFRNMRIREDVLLAANIGCLCGFVVIIIDGLGSFFIRSAACGRVFWIVVAIIIAINYWCRANGPSLTKHAPGGDAPLPAPDGDADVNGQLRWITYQRT